jgi:hypothetical protein
VGTYHHRDYDVWVITREGENLFSQGGAARYRLEPLELEYFSIEGPSASTLPFHREHGRVVEVALNEYMRAPRVEGRRSETG